MTEVLRKKIVSLVRGEEGVALVVTLALFMFLYISCAGVYTVGKAVKERIILQNAVDAAAYSAAVVQADYISRIATINKAMAWNYAQLVKAQRNWIGQKFFERISAADRQGLFQHSTPVYVAGSQDPYWIADAVKNNIDIWYDSKKMQEYADAIVEHAENLEEQYGAIKDLKTDMFAKVGKTITDVLKANLPYRLGELCRINVKTNEIFTSMTSSEAVENRFLDMSGDGSVGKLKSSSWFQWNKDLSEGFGRKILYEGQLKISIWTAYNDAVSKHTCDEYDAIELYGHHDFAVYLTEPLARPQMLIDGYFPADGKASEGAITVAVAKKNENPWLGLIADLTGFYSAFDHADKNDWTFAIASAQAGYRNNKDTKVREYSLNEKGFDYVKFGKSGDDVDEYNGHDWDAVYVPVRKVAFPEDGAAFESWFTDDTEWNKEENKLIPEGYKKKKYVTEPLEEIKFDELNHEALPKMHNNSGADKILKWDEKGDDKFLDLMYH